MEPVLKGIDVSKYQSTIDWKKVKASGKVDFVMLRSVSTSSAYGGVYIDPTFEKNYWGCIENDIPVGSYYYTYATDEHEVVKELEKLKTALENKTFTMPICIDVEDESLKSLGRETLTRFTKTALAQIEAWGFYAMLYSGLWYSKTYLNLSDLSAYDMWLAAYRSERPDSPSHGIWQYSSKGTVNGVKGNVDMNYAYKNYPSIIKKAGLTTLK